MVVDKCQKFKRLYVRSFLHANEKKINQDVQESQNGMQMGKNKSSYITNVCYNLTGYITGIDIDSEALIPFDMKGCQV